MKVSAAVSFAEAAQSTHVIGVFQADDKGKVRCLRSEFEDFLGKLAGDDAFKGRKGQAYFVRALDEAAPNLLFVGLGKPEAATGEIFRVAGANVSKKLEAEKIKTAAVDLASFSAKGIKGIDFRGIAATFAEGALLASYRFDLYKSEKSKPSLTELALYAGDKKRTAAVKSAIAEAEAVNDAITIARDLSNEPGSHLYPMELARRAQKMAKDYGISCKILDDKTCKKEKMGGIVGVGQGSENPPCLIVLEYKPKSAKKTVAFVGKAVTFDSGGISLKPGQGMEEMKHDMSGGADVLAAILLAAKLKVPAHIVCVIASAENMPDGKAIVPSTILYTRSGKTIEVQNTDAEGRLILADALDYAQDYNPDAIVDVATLTGAVIMALSNVAAGIMGNDDKVVAKWKAAAKQTEERYVELPIFQEYADDMKSKIADLKNIGGEKGAGSQKGGAFLREFVRKGNKWLHVDIAGTAWAGGKHAYDPSHGASGHTVRTLVQFAKTL
ncbi:MAG TPA: leucyl aminopeptidase [Bdellovibrionota bacterium]|jgi:leucyl aminopeptidase